MNLFGLFQGVRINGGNHIQMVEGVNADEACLCVNCEAIVNASDLVQSKYGSSCPKCTSRQVYSLNRLGWNVANLKAEVPKVKPVGRLPKSGVFIH